MPEIVHPKSCSKRTSLPKIFPFSRIIARQIRGKGIDFKLISVQSCPSFLRTVKNSGFLRIFHVVWGRTDFFFCSSFRRAFCHSYALVDSTRPSPVLYSTHTARSRLPVRNAALRFRDEWKQLHTRKQPNSPLKDSLVGPKPCLVIKTVPSELPSVSCNSVILSL